MVLETMEHNRYFMVLETMEHNRYFMVLETMEHNRYSMVLETMEHNRYFMVLGTKFWTLLIFSLIVPVNFKNIVFTAISTIFTH